MPPAVRHAARPHRRPLPPRRPELRAVTTNTIAAGTARARLRWAALGVPAFTIGWASAQVMGEVVDEAMGRAISCICWAMPSAP
ncbi:MAG TPA: hypothetical protein VGR26_18900 [Acidimicrobiales bacterium]|nr:hypothetical protein [Acidimicrobiales bacterium]